jgi:hypothetical protein
MRTNITIIAAAMAIGAFLAHVDTRPGWDDTGIIAGAVFVAAAALSFARPRLAPVIAIAVGGWIPLFEMGRNTGSLLALGVALVGALCSAGLRTLTSPTLA